MAADTSFADLPLREERFCLACCRWHKGSLYNLFPDKTVLIWLIAKLQKLPQNEKLERTEWLRERHWQMQQRHGQDIRFCISTENEITTRDTEAVRKFIFVLSVAKHDSKKVYPQWPRFTPCQWPRFQDMVTLTQRFSWLLSLPEQRKIALCIIDIVCLEQNSQCKYSRTGSKDHLYIKTTWL